ncbi:MAG: OmpA family protein [Vulcanimicrobiaceae bacterium]
MMFRSVSSAVALLSFLLLAAATAASDPPGKAPTEALGGRVIDLVFRVDDIGAHVQSLAVKESRTEVHIDLASDVLFDFDSADLLPEARRALATAAQIIRTQAHGQVRILGYTDSMGTPEYNLGLSDRRAQSVRRWFVDKGGLSNVAFTTEGFGTKNPVAPNANPDGSDSPAGRRKNRRVEIIVTK